MTNHIGDIVRIKTWWSSFYGRTGVVTRTRTNLLGWTVGVWIDCEDDVVWFHPKELEKLG